MVDYDHKDNFYLEKQEPTRGVLLALRTFICKQDSQIYETIKYGMPCFCYQNKVFCYLWTEKKTDEPYILMVEGKYLNHHLLEKGNRSKMKILRIDPNQDLPIESIHEILKAALDLYRNGVKRFDNK